MNAFWIIPIIAVVAGTGLFTCWRLRAKQFKKTWNAVFPDCPYEIKHYSGGQCYRYFNLHSYKINFEVRKGTRSDGIWGVTEVILTDWCSFDDGTDMIALQRELNVLAVYLSELGLTVTCEHDLIRTVDHEVSKISNLKYLASK